MYKYVYEKLPISFNGMFTKLNSYERNSSFQLPMASYADLEDLISFQLLGFGIVFHLNWKEQKIVKHF